MLLSWRAVRTGAEMWELMIFEKLIVGWTTLNRLGHCAVITLKEEEVTRGNYIQPRLSDFCGKSPHSGLLEKKHLFRDTHTIIIISFINLIVNYIFPS